MSGFALLCLTGLAPASDADLLKCTGSGTVTSGEAAFGSYCVRCHKAPELARRYFGDATASARKQRELELAAFLDRHSACPHRSHEDIAAWLRQLSEKPGE